MGIGGGKSFAGPVFLVLLTVSLFVGYVSQLGFNADDWTFQLLPYLSLQGDLLSHAHIDFEGYLFSQRPGFFWAHALGRVGLSLGGLTGLHTVMLLLHLANVLLLFWFT